MKKHRVNEKINEASTFCNTNSSTGFVMPISLDKKISYSKKKDKLIFDNVKLNYGQERAFNFKYPLPSFKEKIRPISVIDKKHFIKNVQFDN